MDVVEDWVLISFQMSHVQIYLKENPNKQSQDYQLELHLTTFELSLNISYEVLFYNII
jgi:ABC-type uncharacterized transport system auxiliary subunit